MALYHVFNDVDHAQTGASLSGVQVRVKYDDTEIVAPIYADQNGTDFEPANYCVTDADGMYSFYIAPGEYKLEFLVGSQVVKTIRDFRPAEVGPTGPAQNTYLDTAGLEASNVALISAVLAENGKAGTFTIRDYADFTAEVAADTGKVNYIQSTSDATKVWVRSELAASALGRAPTDANMGTTPGTILSDNGTAKQWFQESEAAIEERVPAADLAAEDGAELVGVVSPAIVGPSTGLVRTLGEKAGEIVTLRDLAGSPGGDDYTAFFTNKIDDYPFKTIQLHQGVINLAGAGCSGVSNVRLLGYGDNQTTLMCPSSTLDMLEINDGNFWRISNIGIQHAPGATAGRGILFSGISSSNWVWDIFGVNNPDGLLHFIGDGSGSGQSQSNNRAWSLIAIDNGNKQISFKYSNDWGLSGVEAGRVTGAFGYPDYGIHIEESHQGALTGLSKAWDNVNGLYIKNSMGVRVSSAVRIEESRNENIILDGCSKVSLRCQTHTASKAGGLAGTYSAVLLKGSSTDNVISIPHIYSWDAGTYLMKYGVEIEAGSEDNRVGEAIIRNVVSGTVGGAGATDGTNYISDIIPRAAADYTSEAVYAINAAAGGSTSLTPIGGQAAVGFAGIVPGQVRRIKQVDMASGNTPGSGHTYLYTLIINGVSAGATCTTINGAFSSSMTGLNIAVNPLDLVEVLVTIDSGANVTNHRGVVTFAS